MNTIDRLDRSAIKLVAFTGGEPFLLGHELTKLVRHAHQAGFTTRIVSSGYFGTTLLSARERLREVVAAGLNELSLSWDDFHEEFVAFATLTNVVRAAEDEFPDLVVAINCVESGSAKWTPQRIREELTTELGHEPRVGILASPLNLTGRADDVLHGAGLSGKSLLGPCPFVMTGPTLSAKGKLLACCGVIPNTDRLTIDSAYDPQRLAESIDNAGRSSLYLWLYLRGPYAILEWFRNAYSIDIPERDTVGGNCQACKHLFENAAIEARLDEVLLERAPNLYAEYQLLKSLHLEQPAELLSLWYGPTLPEPLPTESPSVIEPVEL